MDASKTFNEVIEHIEKSKLNYVIQKTPFSAQISIKRSMIKYYDAPPHFNEVQTEVKEETSDAAEIVKLTKSLAAATENIDKLEEAVNRERNKVKSMDEELANLRNDNLKVKKEKKELKQKLDIQERSLKTEVEIMNLIEEKANVDRNLRETCDALHSMDDDYKLLQESSKEAKLQYAKEIESLKTKSVHYDSQSVNTLIPCQFCVEEFKSKTELTNHVRVKHYRNQVSQTEPISISEKKDCETVDDAKSEEFLCFYCEILLEAGEDLELHKSWCQPIPLTDFPCKKCGAQCIDEKELETHLSSYHGKDSYQAFSDKHEDLNTCDFCGIKFGTLGGLRNHIRSLHKEMLPG